MLFLADGKRFIWESQRNGWNNFYLYDLSGRLIAPLTTSTTFEAAQLVKLDERAGVLFYTARDGDNRLKLQLHRVGLDGAQRSAPHRPGVSSHHRRLHPGARIAAGAAGARRARAASRRTASTSSTCIRRTTCRRRRGWSTPATGAHDRGAREERHHEVRRARTEEGGAVHLHGRRRHDDAPRARCSFRRRSIRRSGIRRWSASTADRNSSRTPRARRSSRRARWRSTDFSIVNLDSRAVPGLGKRALDGIYQKLGQAEIDDMAAGREGAVEPSVLRQVARRHLRHVVRRLRGR